MLTIIVDLHPELLQVDWAGTEAQAGIPDEGVSRTTSVSSVSSASQALTPGRALRPGTVRRGLGGARGLGLTSPGSRALRLPPSDNWVPFTLSGLQLSSAAGQGRGEEPAS
jgi:hypothetical protein